ncbi:hypothetical protein [Nonomuraea dietziae]|uniref:hypothetical protein n=1 Tax=Nonomuraea dietziae TaxID=65515 RepID=UPI0033253AD6
MRFLRRSAKSPALSSAGTNPAVTGTAISNRITVVRKTFTARRDSTAAPARLSSTTARSTISAASPMVRRA